MRSQPKINLFCVFGRTEQIIFLSLKQTESDKTNTLGIFGSFILSVKGKSTKLCMLQAFLQTMADDIIHLDELCQLSLIVHLTNFPV